VEQLTVEMPGERPNAPEDTRQTGRDTTRSPVKRAASHPQRGINSSRTHTVVLAYLAVLLVLGIIALLRAPQAAIPEVALDLRWLDWIA
jgi:hypothetical protein